jgi:S1-C subfamily serine protease
MKKSRLLFDFNLEQKLDAVVSIKTFIPDNSYSADLLGTERSGHGVVIREDGLIVTIGYIITEAETVWIGLDKSTVVPGYIVANDYESGLGLVKPMLPVRLPKVDMGRLADLNVADNVLIAGHGGTTNMIESQVVAKKEFAGRWEYILDQAIYTSPVYPDWAGSALLGEDGKLYGIGCLLIPDVKSGELISGTNLFVPVDTIVPYIEELCETGGRRNKPRPWLGILVQEESGQLVVAGIFYKCPADKAGIQPGDIIIALDNKPVSSLGDFFRSVWAYGEAGVEIPLTVLRETGELVIMVKSGDRELSFRRGLIN